ncbi:MAG TPA: hypothetical protein VJ375_17805, partial [Gaiellaceae bacterium]|nr:hypothetical protein [Gaiellaceae bacterium]
YVGSAHKGKPAYVIVGVPWAQAPPLDALEIEARVWAATCSLLLDRDKLLALIPSPAAEEEAAMGEQVKALQVKVIELETASARLEVSLAKNAVSEQVAGVARQDLARETAEARDHLARLEGWQVRAGDAHSRREQILTLADLDEALSGADIDLQAHVYDVLDLEAMTGELSDGEVKQRVRDVLGEGYPEERFTPGALSVWRTTMVTEDLVQDVKDRQPTKAAADSTGIRLTVMGQLAADTAARFTRTSALAGRRSGR